MSSNVWDCLVLAFGGLLFSEKELPVRPLLTLTPTKLLIGLSIAVLNVIQIYRENLLHERQRTQ